MHKINETGSEVGAIPYDNMSYYTVLYKVQE